MMAGAAATLAAQWGLIPRLRLSPRSLILWGSIIAAMGLVVTMLADDLYGIVLGFGIASLGFGFTRPGFTGGASLAVPLGEQGGVAGVGDRRQWIKLRLRPGIGILLYGIDPHWPFAVGAALLLGLVLWGARRLLRRLSRSSPGLAAEASGKDEADAAHRPHRLALQRLLDPLIFAQASPG